MRGNDVIGILFAYVHEERVRELTQNRVMASVPYGGRYRLVDFPLSNMVNSGINKVGVITEQNYQSLMDHLGSGKAWDLSRKREGLYLLPPFGAETMRTEGKISSLASIMRFLKNSHEEYVLLSDCDTVANIDDTDKNVVYTVDPEGFIRDMVVKRGSDTDCNFGMGMCLIGRKRLMAMIEECMGRNLYDFDRDLLQRNLPELRVVGYEFTGAAYCISSLGSYFKANMALMEPKVRTQLFEPSRPVYTKVRDDMPTRYGLGSVVSNSIVADGCLIEGEVENCVLFRGVQVHKGAKLRNCVIMQDSIIGENSRLDFVVADKDTVFDPNRTLMGYQTYPVFVAKGSKV